MKILIIEDNTDLLKSTKDAIGSEGFVCETAMNFFEAEDKLSVYEYDLIVIDLNLPGGSGLELIRGIKKREINPGVIVISARNSLDDKVEGLSLGADDYITKPFDMAELIARIKSVIRRKNFSGNDIVRIDNIEIYTHSRKVMVGTSRVNLTKSEFDILLFFASNPERILTRETIAEHIWGDNIGMADTYDFIYSHIKNLRKKISDVAGINIIKAVYGIGYRLTIDTE